MVFGRWITKRAIDRAICTKQPFVLSLSKYVLGLGLLLNASASQACEKPLYLTFDTGHMGVADFIAETLNKHQIKATFFLANEKTLSGGGSLDDSWASWWQARAAEGHAFGSHTFDHVYWVADTARGFKVKATAGAASGQVFEWTAQQYCTQVKRSDIRFKATTGRELDKSGNKTLFRAPGGKTSPKFLQAINQCGFKHIGWSSAGFLGDELPSDKFSNQHLLVQALTRIKSGDILLAHLGIWSRKDPWAPAVLDPLIAGLKARGFCFKTLKD